MESGRNCLELRIEKGIPLPLTRNMGDRRSNLPPRDILAKMETGDSILCTDVKQKSISAYVSLYASSSGKKFTCRKSEDGYRVWRLD